MLQGADDLNAKPAMANRIRKTGSNPGARRTAKAVRSPAPKSDGDFIGAARQALEGGNPDAVADALLQDVFAAAVKLYAAKAERRDDVVPFRQGEVTATEAVVAACALIRAADLNLFDVAMWFNRAASAP
jgi:hypothetical protein